MKKILLILLILIFAQTVFADGHEISADDFRERMKECREYEDSLRNKDGPWSFTQEELDNPIGDPSIEENQEETTKKIIQCMKDASYAFDLFEKGEISQGEYDEARGEGDYTFGLVGRAGSLLNQCAYGDCFAMVQYYSDSGDAETDPEKKIELYDKAYELFIKCLKLGTSALIDPSSQVGRTGSHEKSTTSSITAS